MILGRNEHVLTNKQIINGRGRRRGRAGSINPVQKKVEKWHQKNS